MKMFVQSPGWNPFQTVFMIAAVMAGGAGLFARTETSQAVKVLPSIVLTVWYIGLFVGGLGALVGLHLNIPHRLTIKIASLGLLAGITWAYSLALIFAPGVKSFAYSIVVTIAFAAACTIRIFQLLKVIHNPEQSSEVVNK